MSYVCKLCKLFKLKVKNSLLELEKDFIELKDRELKDREVKSNQTDYRVYRLYG